MKKVTDLKQNECIHCTTKEEFEAILKLNPKNDVDISAFDINKKETVYYPKGLNGKGQYGALWGVYYRNDNIYEASDFLTPTSNKINRSSRKRQTNNFN